MATETNWFYALEGRQEGPVSHGDLAELAAVGAISDATLVWRQGLPNWLSLAEARRLPDGEEIVVCEHCKRPYPYSFTLDLLDRPICAICKPYFVQMIRERGMRAKSKYAPFWPRAAAFVIDSIVVFIAQRAVGIIFMLIQMASASTGQFLGIQLALVMVALGMLVNLAIAIGYHTFFVGRFSATPGKMIFKLRVVTATGGKPTYRRAMLRCFAEMVSWATFGIGFLVAAFEPERRTLHDYLASTRVVKV